MPVWKIQDFLIAVGADYADLFGPLSRKLSLPVTSSKRGEEGD